MHPNRQKILHGVTVKQHTGCGNMYITINHIEIVEQDKKIYRPCEIFITLGKSGACMHAQNESLGKIITLALQENVGVDKIIEHLKGIRCPSPSLIEGERVESCSDAIAIALEKWRAEFHDNI